MFRVKTQFNDNDITFTCTVSQFVLVSVPAPGGAEQAPGGRVSVPAPGQSRQQRHGHGSRDSGGHTALNVHRF